MGGCGRREVLVGGAALAGGLLAGEARAMTRLPGQTRWVFDRLSNIGGADTRVEGDPILVDSPYGKAVQFDGVDDRLVIGKHPLAGMGQFTFEALFRPDGGAFAQRWFHLNEEDPTPGAPRSVTRVLFEIRVKDGAWSLDAFATGQGYKQTLLFLDKTFPIGAPKSSARARTRASRPASGRAGLWSQRKGEKWWMRTNRSFKRITALHHIEASFRQAIG